MRRGLGVGYLNENTARKNEMNELGSKITAERVGGVTEQLENLEAQLRQLAQRHKEEILRDPIMRARFRQLADSLGLDLLSSQKNVFSGALGLGDFYYRLAGKVIECCMNERKFCGSYVLLSQVVQQVGKNFNGLISENEKAPTIDAKISEEDVLTALKKLRVFGSAYTVVKLNGARYIQTTADGVKGTDVTTLLNFLLEQQQKKVTEKAMLAAPRSSLTKSAEPSPQPATQSYGAAYVLGPSMRLSPENNNSSYLANRALSVMVYDVMEGLNWDEHRAFSALSRLVQDGTLWLDYPSDDPASNPKEAKGSRKATKSTMPASSQDQRVAVYWLFDA